MNKYILKLKNITKLYGNQEILKNISLTIEKNSTTALIGPNGAGKSTLIKIMLGLIPYDEGKIFREKDITVAYAPEECKLYPDLSVSYFLKWIKKVKNISLKKLLMYINLFELEKYLNKKIKFLSKGYLRRLILIQALIGNENLIVLDEPSDGLDIEFKFKLQEILRNIGKEKTLFICSHESIILNKVAKKIIILNKGEKIFDGVSAKLKNSEGKLYIEDIYMRFKNEKTMAN